MLEPSLLLLPRGAREISPRLAVVEDGERLVVFDASGPIYQCAGDDREGLRLAAGMFSHLGLAGLKALGDAFDMDPSTVFRSRKRLEEGGVEAIRSRKRGPKQATKLTAKVCACAQRYLDQGWSIRRTSDEVGVSEGALRHAIKRGLLAGKADKSSAAAAEHSRGEEICGPAERAAEDQGCEQGVAVKRTSERALACAGKLSEAPPIFKASEAVQGAGVLLALPALMEQGLIEVGQSVYGCLRNGFFGLRSVVVTLCFMALLRIKNPEQLTGRAPGELGLFLGLDRAPEVKTLRGKLAEMGERKLARVFHQRLAEHWTSGAPDLLGLLYVDGHVRPYNGRVHKLPEHHVQRRGRPMPGTQDFHVNDERADPLFCVTAQATESLLKMMDEQLLPEARRLVGRRRRVTIVFDREGWSPESFKRWYEQDFDVLTYRKGKQSRWQERFFTKRTRRIGACQGL